MKSALGILAALLVPISGCQSMGVHNGPAAEGASITHVVVCWLKDPASAVQRQALLDAATEIRALPEVAGVTAGTRLVTENPLADHSWDLAFLIDFRSEPDLIAYEKDPVHLRLKRDVLAPNVRQVKVFDIKE